MQPLFSTRATLVELPGVHSSRNEEPGPHPRLCGTTRPTEIAEGPPLPWRRERPFLLAAVDGLAASFERVLTGEDTGSTNDGCGAEHQGQDKSVRPGAGLSAGLRRGSRQRASAA